MGYIISKVKDNIRKYGMLNFLKRAYIKISNVLLTVINNLLFSKKYNKELNDILSSNKNKKVIVFYPFFDFNMPNFQRFQQVAIALGNQEDVLFFYCTPNNIYDHVFGFKNIKNNLYITNQYEMLLKNDIPNRCVYFVSTDVKATLSDMKKACQRGDTVIYDYVDDMHEDIIGSIKESQIQKHKFAIENKDIIVLVTADKLLEEVHKTRKENVYLVTNGVNVEDFIINESETYKSERLDKLIQFKNKFKVTICYYGAFAKWFDYELIKYIAKNKDIGIVLIGIDYDMTLKNSNLLEYNNIIFLGAIEYKNLKYYATKCDIMTIPFVVNELTHSTSPVKLFEYMALKKPIIVTDMLECRKYKSVNISKNYQEFEKLIRELSDKNNKIFDPELTFHEAEENSWLVKAKKISEIL